MIFCWACIYIHTSDRYPHLFRFSFIWINMFMDKTVEYTTFTMTRFIQMKIIISKCETPLLNIMMCFYTGKLDNHSYFYSIWQVESPLFLFFFFLSFVPSFSWPVIPTFYPRPSSLFIHSLFLSFLFHFLLSKSVSFFLLSPRFSPPFKQSVVFSPICSALFSFSRCTFSSHCFSFFSNYPALHPSIKFIRSPPSRSLLPFFPHSSSPTH